MIKKIVYISYLPLTQKVFEDFFMDKLKKTSFEVEYIDLSALFHHVSKLESIENPIVCKLKQYRELSSYLKKQDKSSTIFISMITYEWRCITLYRQLTLQKCLLGRFANNMNPVPANTKKRSLVKRLAKVTMKKLGIYISFKLAALAKKIGYIKTHDIVFSGGIYGYLTIGGGAGIDMAKAKVVQVNSTDYNTYQSCIDAPRLIEGQYALFLDEYLPLHPDFELFDIKTIDPDHYYKQINIFFDQVEKKYGIPVIIAAHPKALLYKEKNFFNGRQVIFSQTAILVRDSQFVMAHGSTSCGFVAMFNKPLTILLSQAIEERMPNYDTGFRFFATTFGSKVANYDTDLEEDIVSQINLQKYNTYKYGYLTSKDSEKLHSVDIVINTLKKYPN